LWAALPKERAGRARFRSDVQNNRRKSESVRAIRLWGLIESILRMRAAAASGVSRSSLARSAR